MKTLNVISKIESELNALEQEIDVLQGSKSKRNNVSAPSLIKARRDTLKAHLALQELEQEYNDALALDLVDADDRHDILAVAEVRNLIGKQYVRFDNFKNCVKTQIKTMESKLSKQMLESLHGLEGRIKEQGRKLQVILLDMPDVGMTFEEWDEMTADDKRASRSPGRPKAPIEAAILHAQKEVKDNLEQVIKVSNGKIATLEQAIDVKLSNSGRPEISEIAKMDRKLITLTKRLEALELEEDKSSMHDIKVDRLTSQIADLRSNIIIRESELTGAEVPKRQLEKLRSKHRDLVVAEMGSRGHEQLELLMNIIRNENEQLDVIEKIMELDPKSSISVTHKVNPKETRYRFDRLRMNGRLKQSELDEVEKMETRLKTFSHARRR